MLLLLAAGASPQQSEPVFEAGPGAEIYSQELQRELAAAWSKLAQDYKPRTRHLRKDGLPEYSNRLLLESSPYLLQHAHNPVDWRPWGDEAFEAARRLGRPVLLSIGYSTCHWCHVMEEESFEDPEIAELINERYIAVKVDREQRPDVDGVYLAAVESITGRGGWPLTVWLTPDRDPFYGGTYFPPRDGDRGARTGFLTLLGRMSEIYHEQPETVTHNSALVAERVGSLLSARPGDSDLPEESLLESAVAEYAQRFDHEHGGVEGAPKFPSGLPARFLLERAAGGDEAALPMALETLRAMAAGGIHDPVHGGFHRYTVDAAWRVPHFEKMLYDNALLVPAYIEGWRATGDPKFEAAARDILRFLSDEMTAPGGGFYSATDADSLDPATGNREEGFYFTWTAAELEAALGPDAALAAAVWSVSPEGDLDGRNILRRDEPLAEIAEAFDISVEALEAKIPALAAKLRAARADRPKPLRDDKILAGWNGLAIAAFAEASFAFNEPAYADAARRAAGFLLTEMRGGGRLARSWFDGETSGEAYLDDYAAVIGGLISLYESTGEVEWLREAIGLDRVLDERFAHPGGGYYLTADDHEKLLVRPQPAYDGAEPSGNSLQAMNLLRLLELTGDDRYRARADSLFAHFTPTLEQSPDALSEMLRAAGRRLATPKQTLFVAETTEEARRLASEIRSVHAPYRVVAFAAERDISKLSKVVPLLEGKRAIGGRATAYVCVERICKLPTSDPAQARKLLAE